MGGGDNHGHGAHGEHGHGHGHHDHSGHPRRVWSPSGGILYYYIVLLLILLIRSPVSSRSLVLLFLVCEKTSPFLALAPSLPFSSSDYFHVLIVQFLNNVFQRRATLGFLDAFHLFCPFSCPSTLALPLPCHFSARFLSPLHILF